MTQLMEDLPIVQEESEEDVEETARMRELLHQPSTRSSITGEVRRSFRSIREQLSEGWGKVEAQATTAVGRTSEYLREHRADEVLDDVSGYVRKHPVQAIGGAVVTGVVIGRLLKR
jgi:ElaB/YqjD/DUF883 family membrane-anchored ribosome-binding protein